MQENQTGEHYFDQAAASWDEKPARIELARSVAQAISKQVPLSKTLNAMEFGCGTGLVTLGLAPRMGRITAVDTSAKMLEMLGQKIQRGMIGNVIPRQLDLMKDELPDDRFDLVYSSMALHHIGDVPRLLGVFARLLKPEGFLAISDLDAEDGGFHKDTPDVFHQGFDRKGLAGQLAQAGFSRIEATTAHVIEKESARTGKKALFPVFLITGCKTARPHGDIRGTA